MFISLSKLQTQRYVNHGLSIIQHGGSIGQQKPIWRLMCNQMFNSCIQPVPCTSYFADYSFVLNSQLTETTNVHGYVEKNMVITLCDLDCVNKFNILGRNSVSFLTFIIG